MKKALAATMTMVAAGAVSVAALGSSASAQEDCSAETYSWNNTSITTMGTWNPTFTTGVTIPGPVGSERLSVVGTSWTAYDRLMEEDPAVTRENPEENGERFTIRIGGSQLGGASADLPDTAAEGAPSPWFSGVISGSFGGVGTGISGGAITLHHAGSGTGFDAFNPKSITIDVVRCRPAVAATTTVAPTTTIVGSGGPTTTTTPTATTSPTGPTTPTTPTTPVAPVVPGTPTTTTIVGSGGPTPTVPGGSLPVTGGDMTLPLILAALAAGTGTVLLMVRRRAGTN
jgi:hypothetical protein